MRACGVTAREAEVLDALTERLTNAQIGVRLFISARTVETHVASLMVKLGAPDRTALGAFGRTAAAGWTAAIGLPAPLACLVNPATFVGRERQLEHMRGCWDAATAGHRQVLLVHGEAGIGKTRLTAEFAAEARDAGAIVLHGRCDETLGVPYDACAEALGPYVRAVPVPTFLGQCGVLADLRRDTESLTELALTGLDPAAIGALIALAPGRADKPAAERLAQTLHAGTDGNPFFAREVLRHLIETGEDGMLEWDRIVVPPPCVTSWVSGWPGCPSRRAGSCGSPPCSVRSSTCPSRARSPPCRATRCWTRSRTPPPTWNAACRWPGP